MTQQWYKNYICFKCISFAIFIYVTVKFCHVADGMSRATAEIHSFLVGIRNISGRGRSCCYQSCRTWYCVGRIAGSTARSRGIWIISIYVLFQRRNQVVNILNNYFKPVIFLAIGRSFAPSASPKLCASFNSLVSFGCLGE